MRVTNQMLSNNFLRDMRTNLSNLSTIQTQMATGKQINKPSDDPAKASKIMQMYTEIDANKQYNSNIVNTSNWLDVTDTTLDYIGKVVTRIDELLVSTGGSANDIDSRKAIKDEINQRVGEISQLLNTSFDGKYIFGGTNGSSKPTKSTENSDDIELGLTATAGSDEETQLESKLLVEISQGVTMEYNITASQVINYETGNDLMTLLKDITSNLGSTDSAKIKKLTNEDLTGIQSVMTNILKLRSEVGAKQNSMESAEAANTDQNLNMTEILSSTEDIDITETAMKYATMQTIYMASLQTSAMVLQPSLLDYL
ncbi:flagellar hook-associated protein FlgL [Clostridium sp.]|jgi:flagellar hook-associated protein 3 FlgL|uniref:flagellar hook-associated protein FlgL n=1 Tax=Clostridium sp. TaxID=1506 RepID=UPI003EF00D7C